jgi:hypothetical protein
MVIGLAVGMPCLCCLAALGLWWRRKQGRKRRRDKRKALAAATAAPAPAAESATASPRDGAPAAATATTPRDSELALVAATCACRRKPSALVTADADDACATDVDTSGGTYPGAPAVARTLSGQLLSSAPALPATLCPLPEGHTSGRRASDGDVRRSQRDAYADAVAATRARQLSADRAQRRGPATLQRASSRFADWLGGVGAEERDSSEGGRRFKAISRRRTSRDATVDAAAGAAAAATAASAAAATATPAAGGELGTGSDHVPSALRSSETGMGRASSESEMGVGIGNASLRASSRASLRQPVPLPPPMGVLLRSAGVPNAPWSVAAPPAAFLPRAPGAPAAWQPTSAAAEDAAAADAAAAAAADAADAALQTTGPQRGCPPSRHCLSPLSIDASSAARQRGARSPTSPKSPRSPRLRSPSPSPKPKPRIPKFSPVAERQCERFGASPSRGQVRKGSRGSLTVARSLFEGSERGERGERGSGALSGQRDTSPVSPGGRPLSSKREPGSDGFIASPFRCVPGATSSQGCNPMHPGRSPDVPRAQSHVSCPCPCPCPCPCSMFHVPCSMSMSMFHVPCPCPCPYSMSMSMCAQAVT